MPAVEYALNQHEQWVAQQATLKRTHGAAKLEQSGNNLLDSHD
jgi:hypothetical protein